MTRCRRSCAPRGRRCTSWSTREPAATHTLKGAELEMTAANATQGMRVALGQFSELTDEQLAFARQLGVSGVLLNTPVLPGDARWEFMDLDRLRTRCEEAGLRLEALENTPVSFYDRAMLG